jgi:hypothetical protein
LKFPVTVRVPVAPEFGVACIWKEKLPVTRLAVLVVMVIVPLPPPTEAVQTPPPPPLL